MDGTLHCYLGDGSSGATDRALHEVQSYGSLRTISPSFTTMDSSPMNDIIEEIIASFDYDLGQLPLPDLSILFPDFNDLLEDCNGNKYYLSYERHE